MKPVFAIGADLAERAVASPRLNFLGRIDVDLATLGTWDPRLPRRTRILVPVDVQAFVAHADVNEPTVDLLGGLEDPAPFADGAAKAPGVHLHWAMPDALSTARHDPATGGPRGGPRGGPASPLLPDAWVVVRTLQPVGAQQAVATGWVIDARTGVVADLPAYGGPAETLPADAIVPLTATSNGLHWTASYAACANRFGFHDPLTDLDQVRAASAPAGFAGDQAVYTVAGWWTDPAADPLDGARAPAGLDAALRALGWHVNHDVNDDDVAEPDKKSELRAAALGLKRPVEEPAPQVVNADGTKAGGRLRGVAVEARYPVERAGAVLLGDRLPRYHTLLHGSVLGVPVGSALPDADDRPAPDALSVALGTDVDDVVAAFGAAGLGLGPDARALAEDAMAAFSMGAVSRLGATDGLDEIAQREHENGFWSFPGTPLPDARADRLRVDDALASGPTTVGRKGRGAASAAGPEAAAEEIRTLAWKQTFDLKAYTAKRGSGARRRTEETERPAPAAPAAESRSVDRPAPRYFRPQPPLVAVRGARPSHRHHGDGLFDSSGMLLCRYPRSAVPRWDGLVDGAVVLPTLGSGAIPAEVLTVVREAILLNPYADDWLAAAGAPQDDLLQPYRTRIAGELVRLYGVDGRYDGSTRLDFAVPKAAGSGAWGRQLFEDRPEHLRITAELATRSALHGTPPSPVALTTWRQPWVPLWLEWEVTLTGRDSLRGWHLDQYDVEPGPGPAEGHPVSTTLHGRSPLGQGAGETLRAAVATWLESEHRRAVTNGTDPFGTGEVIGELANLDRPLDLVSASLDGIREQLLGIDFVGQVVRDAQGRPTASGTPTVLFGGTLRIDALRVVDAFGRTLTPTDAVLDAAVSTVELEVAGEARTIRLRPRFQGNARWLLRLVDASQPPGRPLDTLREAYVDQLEPGTAPNPVAGFLLPDHVDESLEAFTVGGTPLGEIGHDAISAAVTWEPAPGRAVAADAGPLTGIEAQDRLVAEVAAGLVRADAAARALPPDQRPDDGALVTLLRAVDTTLWTVDTFATLGAGTVAALVGRPIAVVRATLRLDLPDDLAEVTVTAAGGTEERKARFDALGDELVEVRIGTLTRSDDAVLGYFVDDDYEHLHLVDKVLAGHAKLTGRTVGQLGILGSTTAPDTTTLRHPYLVTDGVLRLRPRQTTVLTLLMLPMGKVHLTSGVLPRKEIGLADSWFAAGMKRLMPSVRVGPLLVDPAEIRLPLVNLLGDKQTFTRRTGELAWKDDAILAATQTAYLPVQPHEVQEGWIRVTPGEDGAG
ncbi:hypothetical protein [Marmoricola sp. RAF53]|uniref:hypothetical protein n=1 Tax=Marmoricola sp. RAF53 TaxID=3233059 RepID=UPI003F9E8CF3